MRTKSEKKILDIIIGAAENKQAEDVIMLAIQSSNAGVDFMVICGGEAEAHLRAIEEEISSSLRKHKILGWKLEGGRGSSWSIIDLGSIVAHIMSRCARNYYKLEELWGKEAVIYHY